MPKNKTEIQPKSKTNPIWLIVTLTCLALALAALIFSAAGARVGFFMRRTAVLMCGGERVDAAMFAVFYRETLGDLTAKVESYDTTKPADAQPYPGGDQTWHDYTVKETKRALQGKILFAALTGEDETVRMAVEEHMAGLRTAAYRNGMELTAYIEDRYGEGVREKDVRRAASFWERANRGQKLHEAKLYTAEERENAYTPQMNAANLIAYPVKVDLTGLTEPDDIRNAYIAAEGRAQTIAAAGGEDAFLAAIRADLKAQNAGMSDGDIRRATYTYYRYNIPKNGDDIAAAWVCDVARVAGDTAVLGATGDYTVVLCLSPAERREERTAAVWQIFFPYADYSTITDAHTAAKDKQNSLKTAADFAAAGAAYLANAGYGVSERPVADWLAGHATPGDTQVLETSGGYLLVYYDSPSLTLWEWQAVLSLQQAEYEAARAANPIWAAGAITVPTAAMYL